METENSTTTENTMAPTSDDVSSFTPAELRRLQQLRARYEREQHDEFSAEELQRLTFVRWLYRSGRLDA
jgi:hypothetical protein